MNGNGPRIVELAFAAGLDQGNDPRRTVKLITLSNYQWTKRGLIEKRPGYTTLPLGTFPPATSQVTSVALTAGGSGYPANQFGFACAVEFSGGGGTGALGFGTSSGAGGSIVSITVAFGGSGFTSTPSVFFVTTSGSGAAGTATIGTTSAGSLAAIYSLASSSQGTIQATDATSVYGFSGGGSGVWTRIGGLPAVTVTTQQSPLQGAPTPFSILGGSPAAQLVATDWQMVVCNGLRVWWTYDQYVVQSQSNSVLSQVGLYQDKIQPTMLVTDGTSTVWMFASGTSASPSFAAFFMQPSATGGTGRTFFNTPAPSNITWFDAAWDPVFSQLLVSYVTASAGATLITSAWKWGGSGFGTFSVNWSNTAFVGGGSGVNLECISVNCGASGDGYVSYGYKSNLTSPPLFKVDTVRYLGGSGGQATSPINIFAGPGGSALGAPQTTDYILNVTSVETSGAGVWTVAFTTADMATQFTNFITNTTYSLDLISPGVASAGVVGGTKAVGLAIYSRMWMQNGAPVAMTYHANAQSFYVHNFTGLSPNGGADATAIVSGGVVPVLPPSPMAILNGREAFSATSNSFVSTVVTNLVGTLNSEWALSRPNLISGGAQLAGFFCPNPAQTTLLEMQVVTVTTAAQGAPVPVYTSTLYPSALPTYVGEGSSFEAQFLAPPVLYVAVGGGSGVGFLSAGNYTWHATYARVFEDGSVIESQPSLPFTIAGVSAGQVATIAVQQYGLSPTPSFAQEYIILYRTAANGTSNFQVVHDPFTQYSASLYMPNNPQYNALVFTDSTPDASITSNRKLYTDGGVFENICPNSVTMASRVRDRAWLAGTPDGATVYYSDAITNGVGTCNFHDEQTLFINEGETVTGIGMVDNNVYLFTAQAIYAVYGTEGTANGAGNTLTIPQKLPTGGLGCVSPNSVVNVPQGVFFQSSRGIELLDRSQTVSFIGESVKDVVLGIVVASISLPGDYQVRFYGSSGVVLVYSSLTGEWSTWSYPISSSPTTAAALYGSGVLWATATTPPTLAQETPGVYSDNGAWITSSWTTGWITLGEGLEGYRRYRAMQLLGTWDGESGVSLTLTSNYAVSGGAAYSWSSTQLEAIAGFDSNRVQLEVLPVVQRAESVQVAFIDIIPADNALTKGIAWESLTFEVFGKPGRFRGLAAGAKE